MREATGADKARLINMGPRAIDPIIDSLRRSAFNWEASSLLNILKTFGEPAHKRLLFRIDHERSNNDQITLIYALQTSFDDYSRVNLWLDDLTRRPRDSSALRDSLRTHWHDVPIITDHKRLFTDAFFLWYKKNSAPHVGLPAYEFYANLR